MANRSVDDLFGQRAYELLPVRLRCVQKAVYRVLTECLNEPTGHDLHIHAFVAEHQTKQIPEYPERR